MIQKSRTDREVVQEYITYYSNQVDVDKSRLISMCKLEGVQLDFLKSLIREMEYRQMQLYVYESLLEDFISNDSIRKYEEEQIENIKV